MRATCSSTLAATLFWMLPLNVDWVQGHGGPSALEGKKSTEQKAPGQAQELPVCPVMGEAVDFHAQAITDDGPDYCCRDMFIPKFKEAPAKYAETPATQRTVLAKLDRVHTHCPVDGKNVDGKPTADAAGHRIALCSMDGQAKYAEHAGVFKAKLADSYAHQTRRPISGEPIQPNVFTDRSTGPCIYSLCANCGGKLLEDPAKYAPKPEKQGVQSDWRQVTAAEPTRRSGDHAGDKHP